VTPEDLSAATLERPVRVGRYDVTGVLGSGGMGTVYDAVDRDHGTRVALKTLTYLDAEGLLRFKAEFRMVADLSHPNLVALYELSCHDDLWFFTMERIEGVDFITWLRGAERHERPSAPPSVPQLRAALAQLVSGIHALHGAGLLHLDIKPSNVLVDQAGRVVVVDFGLVRSTRSLATGPDVSVEALARIAAGLVEPGVSEATTSDPREQADTTRSSGGGQRGATVDGRFELRPPTAGTPAWMAPEQHLGTGVGEAADWYAVGLVLYLALTGVPAFAGGREATLWYAKRLGVSPPANILKETPEDLSALTAALLDPEPSRRPSGEALVAITSGTSESQPVGVRPAQAGLFGRGEERALLGGALSRAASGGSAVVHLTGASGVGKTALLTGLLDEARTRYGALALRGRCYERESVPYKAFDGMLDELAVRLSARGTEALLGAMPAWIGELSRVFPVLASVPAIATCLGDDARGAPSVSLLEVRRRAVEALRELFASLAAQHPLVLAIDDLQWADADSTAMLLALLAAPAPRGLLCALSFRPHEAAASAALAPYLEAASRLGEGGERRDVELLSIEVSPLPEADAERLASETLAALEVSEDGLAAAIAAEAGGVPFFVLELARYAAQQREAGTAAATTATKGVALEGVLARRVQSLPSAERALVEVLAVANSPIPLSVAFAAAGIAAEGVLRALWSLSSSHFVRSTGAAADDNVELHHDRMREAVLATMSAERISDHHLALGRALALGGAERFDREGGDAWLFDAVRHLNTAADRLEGEEREHAAGLDLAAGRRARRAAAFPLASACFLAGTRLLDERCWEDHYELALALHGEAAEAAYLSGAWGELEAHVALVKERGRTILDQLVAWEAQIDACIARTDYGGALDAALEALGRLGVVLPPHPTEAEVGAEVQRASAALARVGPDGLAALPPADDPSVRAAMRIQTRIGSATFFARPMLFPIVACRLVVASVEHGLSPATPYALSVFGVVMNAVGMLREAHTWGMVALDLIERFDDRSLEARTRHVVHDLVCTWTVPLASTLDDLRDVVGVGKQTGDLEYASYAAHAYVHNAFYAAREAGGLLDEALAFGAFMRGYEQVNALHVHRPFEQALRCFVGRARDPASLSDGGFDEDAELAQAAAIGSRSAQCIVRLLMGLVRYHFGTATDASACFELGRPYLDGVPSTWHVPIFHQYAALAIHALPDAQRRPLLPSAEADLAALRALAAQCPGNFAHRAALVEAEGARADGDLAAAQALFAAAAAGAEQGGWQNDLGLAHELWARVLDALGDAAGAAAQRAAAREAYGRWGAAAKVARL
jgi:predicted ATPase